LTGKVVILTAYWSTVEHAHLQWKQC